MKKLLAAALSGVLTAGIILGGTGLSTKAAETETETTGELTPIKVAASATPHAEILEQAKPILAEEGYDLQVTVFDDYIMPNEVVESGDMDANYFQHLPYLEQYNEEKGSHLVSVGGIHYEPFGIYPGTKTSLDDVADGDSVAVPNDTTNEARALLLLQDNGLIKLKDGAGLTATVTDIEENPYNLDIVELEAAQVARVVDETAYVVLNGNYALAAGFSVAKDALAYEKSDSEAAKTYVNIIAVKEGNEENPGVQALVDVLKSDEIRNYINETYDGAVIPYDDSEAEAESETETGSEADSETAAETETEAVSEAGSTTTFPVTVVDAYDNEVTLDAAPTSIVSLAPTDTEILYAIGAGEVMTGRTDYCNYPEEATKLDSIGTYMEPNMELILSKSPDLVVASGFIDDNIRT